MHAPIFRLLPLLLTISLSSCVTAPTGSPVAAVPVPKAANTETRRAAIINLVKAVCPKPLTPAQLRIAANYLEKNADAIPVLIMLNDLDREARVCRGQDAR